MSVNVDFIYDFASPNAYLVDAVIRGIEERTGVSFNYVPCLLGGIFKATDNRPPFMTYKDVKGKPEYNQLEFKRFLKKHGLDKFRFNAHFPVNSLLMMRAAAACEIDGTQAAYIRAGLDAMWEKGLKLDEPDVFIAAMNDAGLDGQHLYQRAQEDDAKERLKANTAAAVERGVFGIPTFFVGKEMFFGKERLGQVEEEIQARLVQA